MNGWEVQTPLLRVPTLKSLISTYCDEFGARKLNWKVRGPVAVSVAVAVQVMVLPIGAGDLCDGVKEDMTTVADAGAHDRKNGAAIERNRPVRAFMKSPSGSSVRAPMRQPHS